MSRKEYPDVTINLVNKLREVFDDDNFIITILAYAGNIDDQQKIIDFINVGADVDDETVTVLAMDLCDEREKR